MAQLIDQISNSGLFAQSAYSAAVATNDDLGRKISTTYLTAVDLSPYATETLVEETSGAITSLIPTNYYPDTNPSGFISGVDLSPYQTIEGMTAYQPAGDYATTADLAEKQDTLTFGYDEQDRINSINSSALAGGGDVPEDVMVETGLGYNAVGEISGYGSSAIAQYGAEKQWLQHDDTIVSISNSAQYAFGCNISALQRLMGIDETVIYDGGSMFWFNNTATVYTVADNFSNYNRIKVITKDDWEISFQEQDFPGTNNIWNVAVQGHEGDKYVIKAARLSANGNKVSFLNADTIMISSAGAVTVNTAIPYIVVSGIIGIGRKA